MIWNSGMVVIQIATSEVWIPNSGFWFWRRPDAGLGILGAVFGIQGLEESVGPTFETLVPEILVCQGLDSESRIMNARTLLSSSGIQIQNSEFGSLEVQIRDLEFWICMVRSGIAFWN